MLGLRKLGFRFKYGHLLESRFEQQPYLKFISTKSSSRIDCRLFHQNLPIADMRVSGRFCPNHRIYFRGGEQRCNAD